MIFEVTKLKIHLKEHEDISQKLWEILFFNVVLSQKSYLILHFVFETERVLFFLHLEKVYLLLATLRVFSDHNSSSLLIFLANYLTELCWCHLQSDMPWSILGMSGDH